ncbi:UbiH/UbiF/VisC/COQ6 family ubiquinone biosynthesis hydroxylase [Lentibacter algarum]|uniref:UbiH/UbiF/VisC/COQ6 family ubiquinone biosynthesis hydroxylase n=1 Tax=Lentibacter algarum TaxID=576131 RepID=UPI001C07EE76|nr:UbiH/UbiF/VisC/COQ6 family ubiquinone biosynthesis hydroxylase [Lentibacter algarum]MBU2981129.1 UbiH/UbiF/VisC/COQ6 family ubiquinone biosynthesis hydroxylase [Lentibacter algarum]
MDNPAATGILQGMKYDSDIVIVGGGLNGPALALALAAQGHQVCIIDAQPETLRKNAAFDGRSYALALASKRLLARLGIWEQVAGHAEAMQEIKASDGRAGEGPSPLSLHFERGELEEGPMGYMLEDRYLRRALLEAVAAQELVEMLHDEVVEQDVTEQGAWLTLASGKVLSTRLIVGADGRASGTAERAGIKRTGWDYGQTALVCALKHELPHDGIAHQFFMPNGPLAILPLPDNRVSIVWSEKTGIAAEINALSDEDYLQVLRPRFGDFLGKISLDGKRFSYPLKLTIANHFVAERVALVGDAAHGMHPIAGQGLNAGLRDVAALAHVIAHAGMIGEDFASLLVLQRFQEWRRFDTATLAAATDLSNKLFSNDNPLLRLGRDIGMGVINALPAVKRSFVREAAGLSGELPDLMKS